MRINSSGSNSWKMSLKAGFCRNTPICLLCEIVHLRQITFSLLDGVKDSKSDLSSSSFVQWEGTGVEKGRVKILSYESLNCLVA